MRRLVQIKFSLCAVLVIALVLATAAAAHRPGSDGGPADKGCEPVLNGQYYVGATEVDCGRARVIARAQIKNGKRFYYWNCTGRGTGFGHCHGTGPWRGSMVHWAVND
jgi:hypothetical protein